MPVVMLHRVRVSREQGTGKEQSTAMLHEVLSMLFSPLAKVVQGLHVCAAQMAALPFSFTWSQMHSAGCAFILLYVLYLFITVHTNQLLT